MTHVRPSNVSYALGGEQGHRMVRGQQGKSSSYFYTRRHHEFKLSTQFFTIVFPFCVIMLSGWNCTPCKRMLPARSRI